MYSRQGELKLHIPHKIGIIGCGGIGTWVAIYSAMSGVDTIYLFDDDFVDITNLNRLPYPKDVIGEKKAKVLRDYIISIRPDATVFAIERRIVEETADLLGQCDIVFDTTDNSKAHKIIERLWRRMHFTLIRASYDGEHVTVAKNYKLSEIAWGEDQEGYNIVPSWVIPASFIAQIACWLAYSDKAPSSFLSNKEMMEIVTKIIGDRNERVWKIKGIEEESE